jgi:hemerythrin-like metal-binding protein
MGVGKSVAASSSAPGAQSEEMTLDRTTPYTEKELDLLVVGTLEGIRPNVIDQLQKEMDAEHQQLFELINCLKGALKSGDIDLVKRLLVQLEVSQQSHFDNEQDIMEKFSYPHIDEHKTLHGKLENVLNKINKAISFENLQRIDEDLGVYLESSLVHVHKADKPFQDFLLAFKEGAA